MCLPVFLAQCDSLLIICGETYLTRIWCLVELFVFWEMGADISQLTVLSLDTTNVTLGRVDGFSVHNAKCKRAEDYDHLLSILFSGQGGANEFDKVVKKIIPQALRRTGSMCSGSPGSNKRLHSFSPPDSFRSGSPSSNKCSRSLTPPGITIEHASYTISNP